MKRCTICKQTKEFEEFNKNKSKKDGLNTLCKECSRRRSKQYYKENPDKHKQEVRKRADKVRRESQSHILSYLQQHSCTDCGEKDPVVLEFDHVQGEKEFDISAAVRRGISLRRIIKEIKKCEVRCANCHRRKTAKDFGWYKHGSEALPG